MNMIFLRNSEFYLQGLFDLFLVIIGLVAFNLFIRYFCKRKFVLITNALLSLVLVFASLFSFNYFALILVIILICSNVMYLITNLSESRNFLANKFTTPKAVKGLENKSRESSEEVDTNALYHVINDAVLYLSKHKIGAIITFERHDDLLKMFTNGSKLNAPVTFELLITIFYPGTRLHDGAVIIKGDKIVAASVYYQPTTKPLIGKYGSRHRAAIGVSEICDAITVVVSEETGRISIAYNGEIESFPNDTFYRAFENIMEESLRSSSRVEKVED